MSPKNTIFRIFQRNVYTKIENSKKFLPEQKSPPNTFPRASETEKINSTLLCPIHNSGGFNCRCDHHIRHRQHLLKSLAKKRFGHPYVQHLRSCPCIIAPHLIDERCELLVRIVITNANPALDGYRSIPTRPLIHRQAKLRYQARGSH